VKQKAELNLVDKAVAFFNPKGAVDRLVARQKIKNFEYDAVKYSRERRGPSQLSGAEDYRSNYDRVELMKRARDLAENVGLVRSLLMKFASHVASNVSYQARTENRQANSEIEAYWSSWFDSCDLSGRHSGSTLLQVAIMSMLRDGDFLFALVRSDGDLKLQGIEADRVGDPYKTYTSLELIGGIHIDRNTGAPTAYDIYNRSIGDFYSYQATIPASQAFHLFDPLRIDQYRGITAFHTAINDQQDIREIENSEKMAAKYASMQAAIVRRNNNNPADLSTLTTDENFDNQAIKLESVEAGKVSYLEPGEDIVFPDGPTRPSGAFAEFHKILLRNICMGLGIPYSFAVDPSAMSGPTARLEMQQAGRTFRRYQKLLEDKVLKPLKNVVIADGIARGLIENRVGGQSTRGVFNFGANVSIDLGRDSQAAIAEFKTGLRTAADIYAERGLDFEGAMRQRAQEARLIKDLSNEYEVPAVAISDVVESLVYAQQAAQRAGQAQEGGAGDGTQAIQDISLNGAQVASLINIINAVAAGALTRDGAVSVITAAFPTISEEQARSIMAGTKEGEIIPTTKEERIATAIAQAPQQEVKAEAIEDKKKELFEKLSKEDWQMLIAGMMGGIELGKYDGIDFTPPQGARDAAKRALDVREGKPASQKGMTPVGIARARDLMNGVNLSPDTVRRMKAFFDRHEVDKKGATWDEQGKGWQAWNGWGGDAGYAWARKVVGQMEARDKKELAEPASCPIATQDIKTNLANRQTAVDDANYGPANPNEPNEDYWKAKADEFQGDVATAKKMLCGNCAAFDQRTKVLGCIKKGIGEDANEVAIGGNLGYCEIFDFKCAAKRTCDAWIVGGPMTDEKAKELARPGPKSAAQTPAPPKERIKGSKENPEGTAATRSKAGDIEISEANEQALKDKIAQFKKDHPKKNAPSLGTLKKVFRRGAGAYSTSFRPTITGGQPNSRNAWAMARVNKFLKMAGGGEVKESYRKADGDLLT
jgi:lambda family phage portal protein